MRPTLPLLLGALLAAPVPAQNDFDLDKVTAGTLGQPLSLQVRNARANALTVLMVSQSGGPTPVAAIDPTDPRSVQVGTELTAAWAFLLSNASGALTVNLGLPLNPSLQGWTLHWQTLNLPGALTVVDQISNKVVTQLGLPGTAKAAPGGLVGARSFTAGFFNRSFNQGQGDFVLAGGGSGTLTNSVGLQTSEIWDFRTLRARPGPNLTTARAVHTAVTLNDGRVLLAGGVNALGTVLASCEIYDPVANTFTPTGSMAGPRTLHAATLMADGRVMVAGGTNSMVDLTATIFGVLNSVEIFNPATGTWSAGPALSGRRLAPALTLLNTGRVLVSGGIEVVIVIIPLSASSTVRTQLYNPATNSWSNGANMRAGRAGHALNAVTLNDGRVLMTGGVLVQSLANAQNASSIADAEYYDPAANTWTAANMAAARSLHSASLLPDGRVVVCGGAQGTLTAPTSFAGVEFFDPSTSSWTGQPGLTAGRSGHAAVVLPDGLLVLLGGQGGAANTTLSTVETLHF